ncbi:MAG: M24 family metallopeptidase, partial [Planctomycetes bacterium]|nr:M24 family metallopeptidase [Planctomycetota bacterium]
KYRDGDHWRPLEPGMCFTIEPGLYFRADDERVPERLRGIGVRIEDDIHVTVDGPENLTIDAVKEIVDIEATCAGN